MDEFDIDHLLKMSNSIVKNYAIPGLNSSLIGGNGRGTVRLFECSREHMEPIIPHSHRFDFQCLVLAGSVKNIIWNKTNKFDSDLFMISELNFGGDFGKFEETEISTCKFYPDEKEYFEGDFYSMKSRDIHSIFFSRGAKVLMFEGPSISNSSVILQPYVDNKTVPTFRVDKWMFERIAP
jgi:hypothetical protein